MNVFRILVYTIAAMALVALFFSYILPLFIRTSDPIKILGKDLDAAEIKLGKGVTENILFEETSFAAALFDTETRSVAFECNEAAICCNLAQRDENCSQAVEWDQRKIEIRQRKEIETTARCIYEQTLFVCRIYFGKKPAQVAISSSSIKEKIDLDKEKAELALTIENTGTVPVFFGSIKADVFERRLENSQWKRRFLGSASIEEQFREIAAGEKLEKKIQINITFAGKFDVELKVEGDNAGFDSSNLVFEAISSNKCRAESCEAPKAEFGECKMLCHCIDCLLSSDCEADVKKTIKVINVNGEQRAIDLSDKPATALGTNLVGVLLPAEYCG